MAFLFDAGIFSVEGLSGEILPGTKLYWYESGTSTPLATYSNEALTTPNANPVLSDSEGRFPSIWLQDANYKLVMELPNGTQRTRDPIRNPGSGVFPSFAELAAPTGGGLLGLLDGATAQQAIAVAATPHDLVASTITLIPGSIVRTGDGFLYRVMPTISTDYELETAGGQRLQVLPSIDGVVNIRALAPAGDRVTDDAPKLRAAMRALVRVGGGRLYIEPLSDGAYYMASGDPRGYNYAAITGADDTWTVCEAGENVEVYGDGVKSLILYESNRLGKQLAGTKGDAGALFSNLRVRANVNLSWYICPGFAMRNFAVEWTELEDQATDYIDGQAARIWAPDGSPISHGRFWSRDMTYINPPGHQVFSVVSAQSAIARDDNIINPGSHASPAILDHSSYYFRTKFAAVLDCACNGENVSRNDTMIEIAAQTVFVRGNECRGMNTFFNTVSELNTATGNDKQTVQVANNVADVRVFVADYSYSTGFAKEAVSVFNNEVTIRADTQFQNQYLYQHFNDTGAALGDILPAGRVDISKNDVTVVDSYVGTLTAQGTGIFGDILAEEVSIEGNTVRGARQGVVYMNLRHTKTLTMVRNKFEGGSSVASGSLFSVYNTSYLLIPPGSPIETIAIDDNTLVNRYDGAEESHSLLINIQDSSKPFAASTSFQRNGCSGAKTKDFGVVLGPGVTLGTNFATVDHSESIDHVTRGTALPFSSSGAYRLQSSIRVGSARISFAAGAGGVVAYMIKDKGPAAPTVGYWTAGSRMLDTAGTSNGWRCTVSGTPGTWVAM